MNMNAGKETIFGRLSGRVTVKDSTGRVLFGEKNSITDAAEEVIRGLIDRDFEHKTISYIAIGKGGDCEISAPHNDTGARVGPDPMETEMRSLVEKIPIQTSRRSGTVITLVAVARPEQAQSPDVNELGILTEDGTLFAHFVTAEVAPLGRATKYPKTDIYWIIEWEIDYSN